MYNFVYYTMNYNSIHVYIFTKISLFYSKMMLLFNFLTKIIYIFFNIDDFTEYAAIFKLYILGYSLMY